MGKKHLKQALNIDPDNKVIMRFWKNMQASEKAKEQANELLRANNLTEAIDLYNQCLEYDDLNSSYN